MYIKIDVYVYIYLNVYTHIDTSLNLQVQVQLLYITIVRYLNWNLGTLYYIVDPSVGTTGRSPGIEHIVGELRGVLPEPVIYLDNCKSSCVVLIWRVRAEILYGIVWRWMWIPWQSFIRLYIGMRWGTMPYTLNIRLELQLRTCCRRHDRSLSGFLLGFSFTGSGSICGME